MSQSLNQCQSTILAHALANNFQAATHLATELSQSLQTLGAFDPVDVTSRYLYLRHTQECRMGEVLQKVYENLLPGSNRSETRERFRFSLERIHQASQAAHQELRGLTAGCNPAQRAYPLALCPKIDDEKLFEISCAEAHLTHFNGQAGQVSGIINLILRRLIKGDSWKEAVDFAFDKAPADLTADIREIHQRYTDDHILSAHTDPAYAPNVLHTTLYCVNKADSFDDAYTRVQEIDKHYSPTLVCLLAGARWGIPPSIVENSHSDRIRLLKKLGDRFHRDWEKQPSMGNNILRRIFTQFSFELH